MPDRRVPVIVWAAWTLSVTQYGCAPATQRDAEIAADSSNLDSGLDGISADRPTDDAAEVILDTPVDDGAAADAPTATDARPGDASACFRARRLWFDDFETGDYSRWTSRGYDRGWNMGMCHDNGLSTARAVSPARSHRSEITCASSMSVHRGYGGMQFSGDMPLPAYTNRGSGIDAPNGVVNTYWSYLDVPYAFGGGRWFSFWTVNGSCDWSDRVVTLGLEDASNRLTPAHILNTGGTVTFEPGAPGFPMRTWVRTTIYLNYHSGRMHVWQNGRSILDARFTRPLRTICQWHWGAYASGDNTNVVLFEDDFSIWRLEEPWTDFSREPHFGAGVTPCP